jgi:hypothetical protein
MSPEQIQACIAACATCARECTQFCDAHRDDATMLVCVINCRDCAELCEICALGLETGARVIKALCLACAAACELCIDAFRQLEPNGFRECAEACNRCAALCRTLVG